MHRAGHVSSTLPKQHANGQSSALCGATFLAYGPQPALLCGRAATHTYAAATARGVGRDVHRCHTSNSDTCAPPLYVVACLSLAAMALRPLQMVLRPTRVHQGPTKRSERSTKQKDALAAHRRSCCATWRTFNFFAVNPFRKAVNKGKPRVECLLVPLKWLSGYPRCRKPSSQTSCCRNGRCT